MMSKKDYEGFAAMFKELIAEYPFLEAKDYFYITAKKNGQYF